MLFYKIVVFIKIAVIDKDFFKILIIGQKNAFGYINAVFIKLVVFIKIAVIDNDFYKSSGQKNAFGYVKCYLYKIYCVYIF
jgi:hypothetical protein